MRKVISVLVLAVLSMPGQAQDMPSGIKFGGAMELPHELDPVLREQLRGAQPLAGGADTLHAFRQSLERTVEAGRDAPRPRGGAEALLFERVSPAVVMVMAIGADGKRKGHGSGSVISAGGEILTNWHVVKDAARVGIVFKQSLAGVADEEPVIMAGRVLKVDRKRDLALVQLVKAPANLPIVPLGALADVKVGADAHAIGHPVGETWTYTKGVVSQIRRPGVWDYGPNERHQAAAVIQTQTPINPGNSGGPLLNDQGRIIGVATYGNARAQGINFAVSVEDVRRFLEEPGTPHEPPKADDSKGASKRASAARPGTNTAQSALPSRKEGCQPTAGKRTRDDAQRIWVTPVDLDCDGKAEAALIEWDAELNRGRRLLVDTNGDGKPDLVFVDERNRGQWDYSIHDVDFDGRPDIRALYEGRRVEPVMVTRQR